MTITDDFLTRLATDSAPPQTPPESASVAARDPVTKAASGGLLAALTVRLGGAARMLLADVREAWWTPDEIPPPIRQAWVRRMPDRDRVPGRNAVLWGGWVGYNHTIGLAGPVLAVLTVTALSIVSWIIQHPARIALAGLVGFVFLAPQVLLAVVVTVALLAGVVAMFRSTDSARPSDGQEVDMPPVVVPMRRGNRPTQAPVRPKTPNGTPDGPQAA